MNALELIDRCREHLGERKTADYQPEQWTDAALLRHANRAALRLWSRAYRLDQDWGLARGTLTELGAVVEKDRGNVWKARFRSDVPFIKEVRFGATTAHEGEVIPMLAMDERRGSGFYGGLIQGSAPRGWWLGERGVFYIQGAATVDPDRVLLSYHRPYPQMVVFEAESLADADGSVVTLRADLLADVVRDSKDEPLGALKAEDDHYAGVVLECVDAQDTDPQGRAFHVEAYAVAPAGYPFYDFTIPAHAGLTRKTWAVAPQWPEEQHDLIALWGASFALTRAGDPQHKVVLQSELASALADFDAQMQRRQIARPRYVHYTETSR